MNASKRKEEAKAAFVTLGVMFGITATGGLLVYRQGFIDRLLNTVQTQIIQGIGDILDTIFTKFNDFISTIASTGTDIVREFLGVILAVPRGLANIVSTIFTQMANFFSELFAVGVTGSVVHAHLTIPGVGQVPFILPVFASILLMGIGIMIVQFSESLGGVLPVGSEAIGTIGAIFIVLGSALGLWAVAPQQSVIIFGGAFALILLVVSVTFVGVVREQLEV